MLKRGSCERKRLGSFFASCDTENMVIYGPYPPSPGRTRWRVQVYDPSTQRKLSLTAESKKAALALREQLEREVKQASPLLVHEAIEQYLEFKRHDIRAEKQVEVLGQKLRQICPNVPVASVTRQKAEQFYLDETKRAGKYGLIRPATHQARLRLVKAMWAWMIRREMAVENPWERVEPIGKVSTGKQQLGEGDARKLDKFLFTQAEAGDEGALALLVELYLGLRSSEVLSLTVGACHGKTVWVNGTKTKNAKRKLELYGPVAELLARHCASRPESERVFAANLPKQPSPNWTYKRLKKICGQLGIPSICPHSLRGLHSSLALEAGATTHHVAKALGHASFSTTERHYAKRESIEVGKAGRFVAALHGHDSSDSLSQALASLSPELAAMVMAQLKQPARN